MKNYQLSGAALRDWRERRGMTQTDLAMIFGISGRTLATYESAEAVPNLVKWALQGLEPMLPLASERPKTGRRAGSSKKAWAILVAHGKVHSTYDTVGEAIVAAGSIDGLHLSIVPGSTTEDASGKIVFEPG